MKTIKQCNLISTRPTQRMELPEGAEILGVGTVENTPYLWVLAKDGNKPVTRVFEKTNSLDHKDIRLYDKPGYCRKFLGKVHIEAEGSVSAHEVFIFEIVPK